MSQTPRSSTSTPPVSNLIYFDNSSLMERFLSHTLPSRPEFIYFLKIIFHFSFSLRGGPNLGAPGRPGGEVQGRSYPFIQREDFGGQDAPWAGQCEKEEISENVFFQNFLLLLFFYFSFLPFSLSLLNRSLSCSFIARRELARRTQSGLQCVCDFGSQISNILELISNFIFILFSRGFLQINARDYPA